MRDEKWLKTHIVDCDEDLHFFGVVDSETSNPDGTSIMFFPKTKILFAIEENKDDKLSGMYYAISQGSESAFRSLDLGFYENHNNYGPHIGTTPYDIVNGKYQFDLQFYSHGNDSEIDGPHVVVETKEHKFTISQYKNGEFLGRLIRFEYGKLILDQVNKNNRKEIVDVIDCGWDFEPTNFEQFRFPDHHFGFDSSSCKPAITEYRFVNRKDEHHYYGMIEIFKRDKLNYRIEKYRHIFTDEVRKTAIIDYPNGNKYFGEIKQGINGKGDYRLCGIGCVREKDRCFLGSKGDYCEHNIGMEVEKNVTYFGDISVDFAKNGLIFERRKDSLILATYCKGKRYGKYYVIKNDTFDVEERDEKGNVTYSTSFNKPRPENRAKLNLSKEDKVSKNYLKELDNLKLTYIIDQDSNICVTGVTSDQWKIEELHIPGFVNEIQQDAFKGLKKLKKVVIEDGVKYIGEGAFRDCPNIENVEMSYTLEVIRAYTFTSKKLTTITIKGGTKLIRDFAFIECKNLKYPLLKNHNCVVENNAFGKKSKRMNGFNTPEYLKKKKEKDEAAIAKARAKLKLDKPKKDKNKKKEEVEKPKKEKIKKEPKPKKEKTKAPKKYKEPFKDRAIEFFKKVGHAILVPLKYLLGFLLSPAGLFVGSILILILYVFLGFTGLAKIFSWDVFWYMSGVPDFFGYNFNIMNWGISLLQSGNFFLALVSFIVTLLGVVLDLIIYLLILIFVYAIPGLIEIILQFILIFILPAGIAIFTLVSLIMSDKKLFKFIILLIQIALAVLYYIFLAQWF